MSQWGHSGTARRSGFDLDDEWWGYIMDCARRYVDSYDDREDLAGETARALLAYGQR